MCVHVQTCLRIPFYILKNIENCMKAELDLPQSTAFPFSKYNRNKEEEKI